MLKISKKVEYALIALLHMAEKAEGELTTARELAESYQIPPELMGKILQKMARKGLVQSIQGVKGGYFLKEDLEGIDVASVVEVVDGPLKLVNCLKIEDENLCGQLNVCRIRHTMGAIQSKLQEFLGEMNLAELQRALSVSVEEGRAK
ncbi:MAG: Rrf2 family transcriptional regulator [Calditrichia bacterium]